MRAAILLAGLLLVPLAAARPDLAVDPVAIDLAPGEAALVTLRASGVDEDGGVYDLFVDPADLDVAFSGREPPSSVTYLPGRETTAAWTARVLVPAGVREGARNLTFTLIERPPPAGRPMAANATLTVVARATPAALADDPPAPPSDAAVEIRAEVGASEPTRVPGHVLARALAWGGGAALALSAPIYLWRRGWFAAILYWRVSGEGLLRHPVRAAIYDAVRRSPGITPARLQRELRISDGQLDHHVRRLVRGRFVVKIERDGARLLYTAGERVAPGPPLAARVREAIGEHGPLTTTEVALRVGVTPQHARYYLEKMVREGGATRQEKDGRRAYRRAP